MAIFSTSPEWYGSDGTLKNIDTEISKIISAVYPIGSIYMSVSPTNPGSLFGGTWEVWGAGRVPVSVDANDKIFNAAGKTGGTKEAQLPYHTHSVFSGSEGAAGVDAFVGGDSSGLNVKSPSGSAANGYLITIDRLDSRHTNANVANTSAAGSNNASNLQPYITCYMWKRTA